MKIFSRTVRVTGAGADCSSITKAVRMLLSTEKSPRAPLSFLGRAAVRTEKGCSIESEWCAWARTRWNKPGTNPRIKALLGRPFFAWNIPEKNHNSGSLAGHINRRAGHLAVSERRPYLLQAKGLRLKFKRSRQVLGKICPVVPARINMKFVPDVPRR